ncbi:MAG: hypothetical protein ACETVV_00275 [Nitrososphaeria archaeon]
MRILTSSSFGRSTSLVATGRLGRPLRYTAEMLGLLLLITPAFSKPLTLSIPEPQYFSPPFSDKPSRLAAGPDGRIWVSIPSQSTVGAFNPKTNATEEYLVPEGMKPGKLLPIQDKVLFLLANRDVLGVLVQGSTQPLVVKLPHQPYDIAPSPLGFWLSLPDSEDLFLFRADNLTSLDSIRLAVAYGEDVICQTEENLWAITRDYRSVAVVNVKNKEMSLIALPERAYALTPSSDESVWLISSEGNLMHLSASGEIHKYPLPTGASASSHMVADKHGGVWYCDSARGRIGFQDQKGLEELPLTGVRPTSPSASPDGYLWFIDDVGGRLGRVRISAPTSDGEPSTTTMTTQVSTTSNPQDVDGSNPLLLVQIALAMVLLVAVLAALLRRRPSHRGRGKHR